MLVATVVCSDPSCPEEKEIAIDHLGELEGLVCECGHGFVLMRVSELRPGEASVVSIATPRARSAPQRRAA